MSQLRAGIVPVGLLSKQEQDAMWRLFADYYADISREQFEEDLARKEHVILLKDKNQQLQGFSTLVRWKAQLQSRPVTVVFSGDTIVAAAFWGQTALHAAFTRYVLKTWLQKPWQPTYWLLITKGWRTYLLLTRFFVRYWPRFDQPTPPALTELMHQLAQAEWPEAWQPERGVLHFSQSHGRLKSEIAPMTPLLLKQPDIRFFAENNPGHAVGDELVCLGQIGLDFAVKTAWKVLSRPFRARR
jgi:hypothetical protein